MEDNNQAQIAIDNFEKELLESNFIIEDDGTLTPPKKVEGNIKTDTNNSIGSLDKFINNSENYLN